MKIWTAVFAGATALVVAASVLGQMGMMPNGMGGPGMMGGGQAGVSTLRHRYVMMNGIQPGYAEARNPLKADDANLRVGKALFAKNCASCHGAAGRGDGPAGKGLNPAPADLAAAVRMPMAGDGYLCWTIAEGGVPVRSAMPPFKAVLSRDQIWQVVLYLRTL